MTPGKFFGYLLLLAAAALCAVTAYPGLFFDAPREYGLFKVYLHDTGTDVDPVFVQINASAAAGHFSDPDHPREIYVTGSEGEYFFLAPFCHGKPACVHPVSGKVFVAPADLQSNVISGAPGRPMDKIIVREAVKAQLRSKFGVIKYLFMPDWEKEGYAEHVAMETGFMPASAICGGDAEGEVAGYLRDRLMMEMLADDDGKTYPSILEEDYSYDRTYSRLMKKYCNK